jgi:hypothetical protein
MLIARSPNNVRGSRGIYVGNTVHRFRDRDVKRVIRASQMAGIEIGAVEVDPRTGRITIIPSKSRDDESSDRNPWDEVLTDAPDKKRPA